MRQVFPYLPRISAPQQVQNRFWYEGICTDCSARPGTAQEKLRNAAAEETAAAYRTDTFGQVKQPGRFLQEACPLEPLSLIQKQ